MKIARARKTIALAFSVVLAALTGCGGGSGGGISGTGESRGTVSFSITDAPGCGYDAVNVTIARVGINQTAGAGDTDPGWYDLDLDPVQRIDLLTLANGVLHNLGQLSLPTGHYQQLRLVLATNDAANPLANSVIPSGGNETPLTTPSAEQSGLKLNASIDVPAGKVLDLAIDFDACKSVVRRGNSGQFNLKPVLSVIPIVSSAGLRVEGYVDASLAATSTLVSLQSAGVPVKATPPDADGRFVLYPVPAGNYTLVVSAPGHDTAVVTGVPVVEEAPTFVNDAMLPIALQASSSLAVIGTVTPATATVRALQSLSGGPTFETQWATVDASSGAFAFSLPAAAPLRVAYVPNPTSLPFVADTAATGHYMIEADSAGAVLTQAIDLSPGVPPLTFVFP